MPQDEPDLSRILEPLTRVGVRFVLIGGLAMVAHGSAHVTSDVDLTYDRSADNVTRLAAALAGFHPRLRGLPEGLRIAWDAQTVRNASVLTLSTDAGNLDLLGAVAGVDSFDGLYERSIEMDMYGYRVRVASLPDLIAMKRAADRDKDRAHLPELEALARLKREGNLEP